MKRVIKNTIVSAALFTCSASSANIIKVTNLGDSGSGSLRSVVAAASTGDTVLMDVSGVIALQAPITINKKLCILGAYPAHSQINGSAVSGFGEGFLISGISGNDTLIVSGFRFFGFDGVNGILNVTNSNIRFADCVFKSNAGAANGQCVNTTGNCHAEFLNCSFIGNTGAGGEGGAIVINNSGTAKLVNCTFNQNTATTGGAVRNKGSLFVVHCTFLNNVATAGKDISNAVGGTVTLYNNIFSSSSQANILHDQSGNPWTNPGGNVYTAGAGFFSAIVGLPASDFYVGSGNQGMVGLRANILVDGYGLEYFPIVDSTGAAIERGITTMPLPVSDTRRAPRILWGQSNLRPDAGACEFTPYRVVAATGSYAFQPLWVRMNLEGGHGGPEYMEFDMPGPASFTLFGTPAQSGVELRIVDGYTQTGSVIAGPRNPSLGNYITPAVLQITLNNTSGGVFDLDQLQQGSRFSGLLIKHGSNYGILANDCRVEIFGNVFAPINALSASGAVRAQGNSGGKMVLGGDFYHRCNVMGGYQAAGTAVVEMSDQTAGQISGNLIGTDITGTSAAANETGIYLYNCNSVLIGGSLDLPSRNVITAANVCQVKDEMGDNMIIGNYLGCDISGLTGLGPSNTATGIWFTDNCKTSAGRPGRGKGNMIVNQMTGIFADNSSGLGATIMNNYVGISYDTSFTVIPNQTGISLVGNLLQGYQIGDGTRSGRNYICGNTDIAIYIDGTRLTNVNGNFIGINPKNDLVPNGPIGIHVVSGSDNIDIRNNMIAGHVNGGTGAGIDLNGAGTDIMMAYNYIGTDSLGMLSYSNDAGILINAAANNTIVTNNLLSGNATEGLIVNSTTNQVIITDNIIGLNATQNGPLGNTNGIVSYTSVNLGIVSNVIAGNNFRGIWLNGCNNFVILGNHIGTNMAQSPGMGNSVDGIYLENTSGFGNIGDTVNPAFNRNVIAYNGGSGIWLTKNGTNVGIHGNSIYANGSIGISLNDGATPTLNDVADADVSGNAATNRGNNGQNFPVNLSAAVCSGSTVINGTLFTTPGNYYLEFFSISASEIDPTGYGEGRVYLGGEYVMASVGTEPFTHVYPGILPAGSYITATCSKDNFGNFETSEFSDTARVTVSVIANAGTDTSTCPGVGVILSGGSSIGTGLSYQWTDLTTGFVISNVANVNVAPTANNQYQLYVSDGICSSLDTVMVTVVPPPDASFTVTNAGPYCQNGNPVTLIPATGGGNFSGPGVSGSSFVPSAAGVGTHTVYYTVSNASCTSTDSLQLSVVAPPPTPILASSSPFEYCEGSNASIAVTGSGGVIGWYANAALTNQLCICNPFNPATLPAGSYVFYVAELQGSCISTPLAIPNVYVWGASQVLTNEPYSSCENVPVQVNITAPIGSSISWNPDSAVSDTTSFSPFITPTYNHYTFYFTTYVGVNVACPVFDSLDVNLNSCALDDVSNAFSPDGDNINDTWIIDAAFLNKNNVVTIYNRWGHVIRSIREYDNVQNVWDGTYNGTLVPSGTYYYTINLIDKNETTSGWVQVIY